MDKERDKDKAYSLIRDYLLNKINKEELQQFLDGFDDHEIQDMYETVLKVYFNDMGNHPQQEDADKAAIEARQIMRRVDGAQGTSRRLLPWVYKIAASLLLLVTFYFGGTLVYDYLGDAKKVATEIDEFVPGGEKKHLLLSDGSQVEVNSATYFSYSKPSSHESRNVTLNGEAYFKVNRDTLSPFLIHTRDFEVRVLGTSFNVAAYDSDELMSVSVVTGKVEVTLGLSGAHYILEKDQKLIFNQRTGNTSVVSVDALSDVSWTEGILQFNATAFSQVEKNLERWYGIEIVVEDSTLFDRKISGQHTNKNIDEVLASLGYMLDFNYAIDDSRVTIQKGESMEK